MSFLTGFIQSANAKITALASETTTAQAVAANSSRRGLILNNTDANPCFVKFGETATTSDFSVRLAASETLVLLGAVCYTGRIDAIWGTAGSGSLVVTEL
jgi:hypothetical protein